MLSIEKRISIAWEGEAYVDIIIHDNGWMDRMEGCNPWNQDDMGDHEVHIRPRGIPDTGDRAVLRRACISGSSDTCNCRTYSTSWWDHQGVIYKCCLLKQTTGRLRPVVSLIYDHTLKPLPAVSFVRSSSIRSLL